VRVRQSAVVRSDGTSSRIEGRKLYETFPAPEAHCIARKLDLHYTPQYGSWLDTAEIGFSALSRQCLQRRIVDRQALHVRWPPGRRLVFSVSVSFTSKGGCILYDTPYT
jgi:hypothetical protein